MLIVSPTRSAYQISILPPFSAPLTISSAEGVRAIIDSYMPIGTVAYMLWHGGSAFAAPVSMVGSMTLEALSKTIEYLPEENGRLLDVVETLLDYYPKFNHVIVCDTAFFAGMPAVSAEYAVPQILADAGIRRYGGYGLLHEWVATRLIGTRDETPKLASVHLGDEPNVATIVDGVAVDSSIGFTPAEGIPSATRCGDIDPTLVFELLSKGFTLAEINQILTQKSGFAGVVGYPCRFVDVMRDSGQGATKMRDILRHRLLLRIGGAAAQMGGLTDLVFAAHKMEPCRSFIADLCRSLRHIGVEIDDYQVHTGEAIISSEDSPVVVQCREFHTEELIYRSVERSMNKEAQSE